MSLAVSSMASTKIFLLDSGLGTTLAMSKDATVIPFRGHHWRDLVTCADVLLDVVPEDGVRLWSGLGEASVPMSHVPRGQRVKGCPRVS